MLNKLITVSILILSFSKYVYSNITIDIDSGKVEPLSTVILDFDSNEKFTKEISKQISKIIRNDLESSQLFRMVNPDAFINTNTKIDKAPIFNDWLAINTKILVHGKIQQRKDKKIRIEFHVWDITLQEQKKSGALVTTIDNYRRIAHIISDYIYTSITGENGYFDTRIAYISETGPKTNRIRRIALMDYDGANHKYLTDGIISVATPVFAPDMQKIAYMTYYKNTPRIYIFDIETGHQELLGEFPGMNFAPRFSPDGKKIAIAAATDGYTNIYEIDLKTKKTKQLTFGKFINTSVSYSPDGKYIVFISDKTGYPQIYKMHLLSGYITQISKNEGQYEEPAWSPRGDYVAFVKIYKGQFYLGVMDTDGNNERLITNDFMVESVSWAPNGRRILYYKQMPKANSADKVKIYSIDVSGRYETEIKTPHDGSDPTWSSLLP